MSGFEKLGHRIFTLEVAASALVFTAIMELNDSKIIKLAGPSQQWCYVLSETEKPQTSRASTVRLHLVPLEKNEP